MEQTDKWRHAAIIKIAYAITNLDDSQWRRHDESWIDGMCEIAADILGLGRTALNVKIKIRAAIESVGPLRIHPGWDIGTAQAARVEWENAVGRSFFKKDN